MSEPPRQFFTGNTLEQAVIAAANYHEVDPDEVAYERVERRYGFLRGRRRVVIKVDPEQPTRRSLEPEPREGRPTEAGRETQQDFNLHKSPAPPVERPVVRGREGREEERGRREVEGREERGADALPGPRDLSLAEGETADAAQQAARRLATLAGLDLDVVVYEGDEQLEVEVGGPDQEEVVRGDGKVLLALQHLLPRLMYSELGEMVPCQLDSGGFRERRAASLERMARRAADEVRERRRPKTLRSLNPADRRTVHLALQHDDDVVTESSGEGFYKRITVRPS